MIKSQIDYLVISDIHLGHRTNKSHDIIRNLDIFFNHYKLEDPLDIVFIAGDLFDRLLEFPANDIGIIYAWIDRLCRFCNTNEIKLRVLEGTPSHDWKQSKIINFLKGAHYPLADILYIDTLHIETMPSLGISVLYVPDEWNSDSDITFKQVQNLLADNKLNKVDIAIMHGQFTYQLPFVSIKVPRHKENDYLDIVNYFISIGHVHNFSVYEKIVAQGSFDRLAHGEEAPKGAVKFTIYDDGTGIYHFIANLNAKIYITIDLKSPTLEGAVKQIDKTILDLPMDSFIRIKANKSHPIFQALEQIKIKYINYNISRLYTEDINTTHTLIAEITKPDLTYHPIAITPHNITNLLLEGISNKQTVSEYQKMSIQTKLTELIDSIK